MNNQPKVPSIYKLFLSAAIVLLVACGDDSDSSTGGGDSGGATEDVVDQQPEPAPESAYQGSGLAVFFETEDGSNIGVIEGEISTHGLSVFKADADISTEVTIETDNPWIELTDTDGVLSLSIDTTQNWIENAAPVTVIATNLDNGLAAQTELLVSLLETQLVASGTLNSEGGVIASNGGAFGIRIAEGELTAPLGVEIWTALSTSGQTKVRIMFDRDVSDETARLSLVSNLNAFENVASAINSASAQPVTSRATIKTVGLTEIESTPVQAEATVTDYPLTNVVASYQGWFLDKGPRILNQDLQMTVWLESCGAETRSEIICLTRDPVAASLTTIEPLPETTDVPGTIEPVLFIHGYNKGGELSGGVDYWGGFPRLVSEMQGPNGESYVPYEFRWRTNASLSIVADDLANAVISIQSLYKKPVRVIAHSYGGLLIRALVQGLAERNPEFQSEYIRSILTLGTPHSGIFDQITTINAKSFPDGQDQKVFNFCGQISCRQGGENGFLGANIVEMTKAGKTGGLVAALAAGTFPESLPMVVGIGLKREGGSNGHYDSGDGLITFEGQRFDPSINSQPLKSCQTDTETRISEVVLGAFDSNGAYDLNAGPDWTVLNDAKGYSHSNNWWSGKAEPDNNIELAEVYVDCDTTGGCQHASWRLFSSTVDFPQDFCDVIPPSLLPTLVGSRVSVALHYPALGLVATVPYEKTVDSQIEIPAGVIQEIETYSNRLIPLDIDVGVNTIDLQYLTSTRSDNTSFNGYVFDFEERSPVIAGASLDELSTFTSEMVEVTYEPHRVLINFSGIRIDEDSRILVNLQFDTEN